MNVFVFFQVKLVCKGKGERDSILYTSVFRTTSFSVSPALYLLQDQVSPFYLSRLEINKPA